MAPSDATGTPSPVDGGYTIVVNTVRITTFVETGSFWASPVVVRHWEGDFPTPTSTSSVSQLASPNTSPGPEHLSTGAKAGIGVGAVVGALALVLLGFLVFRMRKRRRNAQTSLKDLATSREMKAEMHTDPIQPKELPVSVRENVHGPTLHEIGNGR